jgi:hypothetical protein
VSTAIWGRVMVRSEAPDFGEAFSDSEVHGARGTGSEGDDAGLASFAVHPQRVVASFESEVVDIGAVGFRDSQAVEGQQARQGMVTSPR